MLFSSFTMPLGIVLISAFVLMAFAVVARFAWKHALKQGTPFAFACLAVAAGVGQFLLEGAANRDLAAGGPGHGFAGLAQANYDTLFWAFVVLLALAVLALPWQRISLTSLPVFGRKKKFPMTNSERVAANSD